MLRRQSRSASVGALSLEQRFKALTQSNMPKILTLLRKEIATIKKLQSEILATLESDWLIKKSQLKALQPFLLVNARHQKKYDEKLSTSFKGEVIKMMTNRNKTNAFFLNEKSVELILGTFLLSILLGKYISLTINNIINLTWLADIESFGYFITQLSVGVWFFAVSFNWLFKAFTAGKEITVEARNFRHKTSRIVTLIQELEGACENLRFYNDLCSKNAPPSSLEDIEKILDKYPLRYIPSEIYEAMKLSFKTAYSKKDDNLSTYRKIEDKTSSGIGKNNQVPQPSSIEIKTSKDRIPLITARKLIPERTQKQEEIADKIKQVTQSIPVNALLTNPKGKDNCLLVKMSIQVLQPLLERLEGASVEKSHNGRSLLIRFSEGIEIRIICKPERLSKKNATQQVSEKQKLSRHEHLEAPLIQPQTSLCEEKIRQYKPINIIAEGIGKSDLTTVKELLPDDIVNVILQKIANKLKELTGQLYCFSDPQSRIYLLLFEFIQLSYIIKAIHKEVVVRAFGGVWRSLFMKEEPNDIDIALIVSSTFNPEKELFERLKQMELITDYRRSAKSDVRLYTLSFLNSIHEITIITEPSIETSSRTLDFNCNIFALEILQFRTPFVKFYTPLNSKKFLLEIRQRITPTIEAVINPHHFHLLKNIQIKQKVIVMVSSVFPTLTAKCIHHVIEELLKTPNDFSIIKPNELVFFILKLLNFIHDPKRIFRLLRLHQSNYYDVEPDLRLILWLTPSLLNATISLEAKPMYPILSKNTLLHYLGEYILKDNIHKAVQRPLLSDLELIKTVLLTGLNLHGKRKEKATTLLQAANLIYRDEQISWYLSKCLKSLKKSKQKSNIIDHFLVTIALTQTPQIFATIKKTHSDPETFMRLYLLPAFKKQLIEIADLFCYTIQDISSEEDILCQNLLYKWQQACYRYNDTQQHSGLFIMYGSSRDRPPCFLQNREMINDQEETSFEARSVWKHGHV